MKSYLFFWLPVKLLVLFLIILIPAAASADVSSYRGHQLRLRLFSGQERFAFTPDENLEIAGRILHSDQEYIFYARAPIPEWEIQVMVTSSQEKAEKLCEELKNEGFNSFIRKSEEIFKILSGYYDQNTARNRAAELEAKGWDTWVKKAPESKSTTLTAGIFDSDGNLVLEGESIEFQGKIIIEDRYYSGIFELIAGDGDLDVYNTVDVDIINCGLLHNTGLKDRELLKALSVITRNHLIYKEMTATRDWYHMESYQGLDRVSGYYQQVVMETRGEIIGSSPDSGLKIQGDIYLEPVTADKLDQLYNELSDREIKVLSYQDILTSVFEKNRLYNLADIVIEEKKLTATVFYGLDYHEIREITWWGPRLITVLELDLDLAHFYIDTTLAGDKIEGTEGLPEMIKKEEALAGVNGGYFNYKGQPLGFMVKQGQVVSEPLKNRTTLAITDNNEVLIAPIRWQGKILNCRTGEELPITAVNRDPQDGEIALYNSFYGAKVAEDDGITGQILVKGENLQELIGDGREIEIPEDGYLIRSKEGFDLNSFSPGDRVEYSNLYPGWPHKEIKMAIEAGPRLLAEGQVKISGQQGGFQPDILLGRAPRTAAGVTADNRLILVTVDGRQPDLSVGMTLEELAVFMQKLDVVEAVNLDGGNSARMVVRGFTMNNPGVDRAVASGIFIKRRK